MLKHKIFALLVIAALAISSFSPSMAAQPVVGSIDPDSVIEIDPMVTPNAMSSAKVEVVIRLTALSVTEVQANSLVPLTEAEELAIVAQLSADQEALKGAIISAGGEITEQFQYSLNGIRVRIAQNKLPQLAALPTVSELLPIQTFTVENTTSVPYIGAPAVWNAGPGTDMRGEGIKIGIIDTGIDYTHANFGGPGTAAAYAAAHAGEAAPADPALFGPLAPKVKGGYDLAGDAYTAGAVPLPDSNPLDCGGHGSHVAGTAAGFGVNADGTTFAGLYNSSIYTPGAFRIGPGVAPKADLYAYRVFGCSGSTNLAVDAIERAVADGMDVINMSLGSSFGTVRDASAVAATNAAKAGVIVVASAGNAGPNPYITGSPASGNGAISVAASDSAAAFPGAVITLPGGGTVNAINANGAAFADGSAYNVVVVADNPATATNESLGCSVASYPALPANALVVVNRGVCARVAKAIFGQMAGAAAVLMINNAATLPPYEGAIFSNPDTGVPYTVTIPFFGVSLSSGPVVRAAAGGTVSAVNSFLSNPGFSRIASFSSGGPRNGDSYLKPEVTAPGVSTFSTAVGTGNLGSYNSGTSMAAPHVAGVAALVKQAHPTWKQEELKAAIVGTSSPDAVAGYITRLAGAGLVQPYAAVQTNVVAMGGSKGVTALNFGFQELQQNLNQTGQIKVRNLGASAATFNVSVTNQNGVAHTLTPLKTKITVPAGEDVDLMLTFKLNASAAGNSNSFYDAGGVVTFSPVGGSNNGISLHVPYYMVPRPTSTLSAKSTVGSSLTSASPSTTIVVSNKKGSPLAGNADFYAWGLHANPAPGQDTNDVRSVGVQVFPNAGGLNNPLIIFGINTYNRWSTPSANEFDIYVDVDPQNGNGDDYIVIGFDYGALSAGAYTGQYGTFVYSLRSGSMTALNPANTFAPTNSSSAALAILGSQLCRSGQPCLSAAVNPRFTYSVVSYDIFGTAVKAVPGLAKFNAFAPAISTGAYLAGIAPGASASSVVTLNPAEWAQTPALGVMLLTTENKSGADEALEIPLKLR